MSLSIVDISNKKRRQENTSPSITPAAVSKVPTKKRFGSETAMPWAGSDLQVRHPKSRRRLNVDAAMNEDWLSLYEEPLFWLDSDTGSKLATLQGRLLLLEENVHDLVDRSLKVVRAVFFNRG